MDGDMRFHQIAADLRVLEARGCARRWAVFHETYTFSLMGRASAGYVGWRYRHRSYVVGSENLVMVVQPGELHATISQTPAWDSVSVVASQELVHAVARDLGWPFPTLNVRWQDAGASHPAMVSALTALRDGLCTSLFGEALGTDLTGRCTCVRSTGPLLEAFGEVVRALIEEYAEGARQVFLAPKAASVIRRAKEFLHEHYRDPYSLERLAGAAGCGKYYLAHVFKKEFGVSPSEYRSRVLVSKTSELLARFPDLPLEEIAQQVGWGAPSRHIAEPPVMIRNFKRVLGVTPDRFRYSLKGEQTVRDWSWLSEQWRAQMSRDLTQTHRRPASAL